MGRNKSKTLVQFTSFLIIILLINLYLLARAEKTSKIGLILEEQAIATITLMEYTAGALEWRPLKVEVSDVPNAELTDEKLPAQGMLWQRIAGLKF